MVNISDGFSEGETLDGINTLPIGTNLDLFLTIDQIKSLVAKSNLLLLRRRDAVSKIFLGNTKPLDCLGCGNRSDDCDPDSSGAHCNNNKNGGGLDQYDKHPDDEHKYITM